MVDYKTHAFSIDLFDPFEILICFCAFATELLFGDVWSGIGRMSGEKKGGKRVERAKFKWQHKIKEAPQNQETLFLYKQCVKVKIS